MAKGENIFKRKDGRWEARYIKSRDPAGKIRYGYCYGKTYQEAKDRAMTCRSQQPRDDEPARSQEKRFGDYCQEWLNLRKPKLKQSSQEKYETIFRRHIQPAFGHCYPRQITPDMVQSFTNQLLTHEKLAPKTAKDILTLLRAVMHYTEKQVPNAFTQVEIICPREPKKEMRVLSMEEQRRFTDYLQTDMDPCKFGTLLALLTGLRIGELCALKWENISMEERTIRVHSTMQRLRDNSESRRGKTKVMVTSPKSDTSFRSIPLTENAAALCQKMAPENKSTYILTGTERYLEPRVLQNRMTKYTAACQLEGVHFHTLRHTFATRCVEVGFELKSLSEVLGHSSTTVTLERYVHSSMELKRSNMEKLRSLGW